MRRYCRSLSEKERDLGSLALDRILGDPKAEISMFVGLSHIIKSYCVNNGPQNSERWGRNR